MKRMGWLAGVGALVLFGVLGVLGPAGWAQALDVPAAALERDKPAEQADKPDHPEQANNPEEPPGQADNPEHPEQANNPEEPPGQADDPEHPEQANNPEEPPGQANNPEEPPGQADNPGNPQAGEGQGAGEPGNQGSGNAGENQTPGPGGPQQSGLGDPPDEGSGASQEVPVQQAPGVGEKPPVSGQPAGGEATAGLGSSGVPAPGSARMAQGFHALSAAVDEPLELPVSVAEAEAPGFVSAIDHTLEPVLPPVLVSAFTSPLVVAGALVQAVTSSGQVLLLPAGLLAVGILARLLRRPTRSEDGKATWPQTAASREAAPAS